MMARPALYSNELANEVCERLMDGASLRKVCEAEDMPSRMTVLRWLAADHEGFGAKYAQARVAQIMGEADDLIDIADTPLVGQKVTTKANGDTETVEGDMVERTRMRLDTRKWLLEKLIPKVYGSKLDLNHGGGIQIVEVRDFTTQEERDAVCQRK